MESRQLSSLACSELVFELQDELDLLFVCLGLYLSEGQDKGVDQVEVHVTELESARL